MVNYMYYELSRYVVHPESRRKNSLNVVFCYCPQPGTYETLDDRGVSAVPSPYQKIGMYTRVACWYMYVYVLVCVCPCVCPCVRVWMYDDKRHSCSLNLFYQLSSYTPTVESYIGVSSTRGLPIKTLTAQTRPFVQYTK